MLNNLLLGQTAEEKLYVEDVFSTWLYSGTNAAQTINNGIDLAGKGGLVWIKGRNQSWDHAIFDTNRGANNILISNSAGPRLTGYTNTLTSFNNNGFSLGNDNGLGSVNTIYSGTPTTYVSWTFRKAAKFFDIITWTGNNASRSIPHSLGVVPGMIIIKAANSLENWQVWHRSLGGNYRLILNTSAAAENISSLSPPFWGSGATSTAITLGSWNEVNTNGVTYVAYLFAHDTTADGIVQCGSYTGGTDGSTFVNLGWEPQFLLLKKADGNSGWALIDNMRNFAAPGNTTGISRLIANMSDAEVANGGNGARPSSTGFYPWGNSGGDWNTSGATYIYLAIRRGPMRVPTDATKVFKPEYFTTSTATLTPGFPPDFVFYSYIASDGFWTGSRLTGNGQYLRTPFTNAEATYAPSWKFDATTNTFSQGLASSAQNLAQMFARAPGFFDVVCYTGTGSARTVSHNLGVKPELVIIKSRSTGGVGYEWAVGNNFTSTSFRQFMIDNQQGANVAYDAGGFFSAEATSTQITVSASTRINANGGNYVAYLFSSCPGVSKVGSYTGNGSSQNIDCGFTNGARFVLIKRTNSTGDWYVWDTARGIVTANDPHLSLNTSAAEVTTNDSIDPLSSGFTVNQNATTNVNVSSATYIYLAIA